eukprot:m.33488 g.33488  ORF g.33488 m.33488 type:complete len:413 (+) comp7196_c0_seq1:1050-2288(+)
MCSLSKCVNSKRSMFCVAQTSRSLRDLRFLPTACPPLQGRAHHCQSCSAGIPPLYPTNYWLRGLSDRRSSGSGSNSVDSKTQAGASTKRTLPPSWRALSIRQPAKHPPSWEKRLPRPLPEQQRLACVERSIAELQLATVCKDTQCPNLADCWGGEKGATIAVQVLGDTCSHERRSTAAADAIRETPLPPDPHEPQRVAAAVAACAGIDCVAVTSATRDDLPDGGAQHIAETIREIRRRKPDLFVECVAPDFGGNLPAVATLAKSGLDVYTHCTEVAPTLAGDDRSREEITANTVRVLNHVTESSDRVACKVSMVLGLGETEDDVWETLVDLDNGQFILTAVTVAQYTQRSEEHKKIVGYIAEEEFQQWQINAHDFGFFRCEAGSEVRPCYRAGETYRRIRQAHVEARNSRWY